MNAIEAVTIAREYLYDVPGVFPDLGFEATNIHFIEGHYRVTCRVVSLRTFGMVTYQIVVLYGRVQSIEELIE